MRRRFLDGLILVALLLLSGCSRDVTLSTVLEAPEGLRPGDGVYLETREVGSVDEVEVAEQVPGYVIEFSLEPALAPLVQNNAVAYVPVEGPPMLVILNPSETAEPVASGGRLKGLTPLELAIWQVSDAVGRASSLMDVMTDRIESYFESEDWHQTRADIDEEIAGLAASSRSTAERVVTELEGLIESATETAADTSNELGGDIARIEKEIDRLAAEGHSELADSLRRLLERIDALSVLEDAREYSDVET